MLKNVVLCTLLVILSTAYYGGQSSDYYSIDGLFSNSIAKKK